MHDWDKKGSLKRPYCKLVCFRIFLANDKNEFLESMTMLQLNKALWFDDASHMTSFNQLGFLISLHWTVWTFVYYSDSGDIYKF